MPVAGGSDAPLPPSDVRCVAVRGSTSPAGGASLSQCLEHLRRSSTPATPAGPAQVSQGGRDARSALSHPSALSCGPVCDRPSGSRRQVVLLPFQLVADSILVVNCGHPASCKYAHRWASLIKILGPLILIRYLMNLVTLTASPFTYSKSNGSYF